MKTKIIMCTVLFVIGISTSVSASTFVENNDGLYTYSDMVDDITNLSNTYSEYLSVQSRGTTVDGRSIYELIIKSGNPTKSVMIDAGIHAREYYNPYLVMKQVESILSDIDNNKELLSQVSLHVLPMVNPDGIAIAQFGEAGINNPVNAQRVRAMYESNVRNGVTAQTYGTYLSTYKANANGIDLNDQFPVGWQNAGENAVNTNMAYKGVAPLTENESIALATCVNEVHPVAVINYHQRGDVIYWGTSDLPNNSMMLASICANSTGYKMMKPTQSGGGFMEYCQSMGIQAVTLETTGNAYSRNVNIMRLLLSYGASL